MFDRQQNLLERNPTGLKAPGGWFDLEDWVGPGHPSGRGDIAKLEGILANSGDYSLERTQGPTGYWGLALDQGIRAYQKRNGLAVDGVLRPGGPTIRHMESALGGRLEGYLPPTPDDIDRHHDAIGTDAGDVIAWRRPRVDFQSVPCLPQIDQEADASNARLVRAMLRTNDIDGFAPLMKDAIDQGGLRAFAEVADLTGKLDAAQPGLGGRFASAVTGLLSAQQIAALGLKTEPAPPPGTMQVAMMRRAEMLRRPGEDLLEGGGGGGGPTGAAIGLGGITKKLGEMLLGPPGRTPDETAGKPTVLPGPTPALLDVPLHTGSSEPAPTNILPNIPPPTDKQKEIFAGEFGKAFGEILPAIIYADGQQDNRGTDETVTGNNIIARACMKRAGMSPLAGMIEHTNGASKNGEGEKYLKEKTVDTAPSGGDSPFRRTDNTFALKDGKTIIAETHINSATTNADGAPIPRESAQIRDVAKAVGEKFVRAMRKFRKGDDEQAYYDEAFKVCDEAMTELEKAYENRSGGPR